MRVTVFGLGYVGSVCAACFANQGHEVVGADVDSVKVDAVNSGRSPIVETGLAELIKQGVDSGKLRATTSPKELGDLSLVCVGTPSSRGGDVNLGHLFRVVEQIGGMIAKSSSYHVVTIRSTVVPGTVEDQLLPILERSSGKKAGVDFGLCMNPEFMRESTAIHDFHNPPFTVIGQLDSRAGDVIAALYANLPGAVERTPIRVAEMVKYTCNAFHAAKVVFANEIGRISKKMGVDGRQVMALICQDTKLNLSPYYMKPGFAFGGSCLPKDLRGILHLARHNEIEVPMLASLIESNKKHLEEAYQLVEATGCRKIGILGLSFKSGTDDLRESPAVDLIERLIGKGYQIAIYDAEVSVSRLHGANRRYIEEAIPHISSLIKPTIAEVAQSSELLVLTKGDPEVKKAIIGIDNGPKVLDLVGLIARSEANAKNYEGICW